MSEKRETHADIIAEMRERKSQLEDAIFNAPLCYSTDDMRAKVEILDEFLDRLEAAHKRELAQLREAVIAARRVLAVWGDELPFRVWNEKGEALDKCDAALREGGSNV